MKTMLGRRWMHAILGALSLLLAPGAPRNALAQLTISSTPSPGPTWTVTAVAGGKWHVDLNTAIVVSPTTFLIRGTAADKIEIVVVNANVPQTVFVEIRGMTAGTAITSVDGVEIGASTATVVLKDCRTSGSVGFIHVNTISNTAIGGNVTGGITLLPRNGGGESTIINATVSGRIQGNVICDYGAIFGLTATGGLGALGAPVQVRTMNNIVRITAKEIYADLTTLSNAGAGVVGKIEATAGPFVGSLVTTGLQSTGTGEPGVLSIAGDLDADVTINGAVANQNSGLPVISVAGTIPAGRKLTIGTSLNSGAEVRINSPTGLAGLVRINHLNAGGAWSGLVRVGATLLGPVPEYSSTASSLGGGSVGVVPYALHATDCFPFRGQVMGTGSAPKPLNPIRLRHYGPITWAGGGAPPVTVDRRPISSPGAWVDQTACFFVGADTGPNPNPNVILVYPTRFLPGGYVYRVRPVRTGPLALLCDIGSGSNPPVADYTTEYSFTVTGDCPGDVDASGTVNFGDITGVLTNWGGGGTCLPQGDANADGSINFADITTVLTNWGSACVLTSAAPTPGSGPSASALRAAADNLAWPEPARLCVWLEAIDDAAVARQLGALNQAVRRRAQAPDTADDW